jgi:S1-C subfamily serine protease
MIKFIGITSSLLILIFFLIFITPVTRLGSGFLIGTSSHVFTYYDLVKEAKTINIMFPNEDDIKADVIYKDIKTNLAILKLINTSKITTKPLFFANNGLYLEDEVVYTIGYPWANTMEDKYSIISGKASLNLKNKLIDINIKIDPVNSGSPLLSSRNELIGMILYKSTENMVTPLNGSRIKSFIPLPNLIDGIKALKVPELSYKKTNHSAKISPTIPKSNVVLIEAFL